jgi:hypothetical protein
MINKKLCKDPSGNIMPSTIILPGEPSRISRFIKTRAEE